MVKGRAREIPPLVIVAGTQTVAFTVWVLFFVLTTSAFVVRRPAWPAIAAASVLVMAMSSLLARASARGDISVVGPVFALSPIFTVIPDAVLSATLPSPLGWLGIALSVTGTLSLSRGPGSVRVRALLARRDAVDALGAAILLGILTAVDRWGALVLGPPSYLVCSHGAAALLTATGAAVAMPRRLAAAATGRNLITVLAHGLLGVTGTGMQDERVDDGAGGLRQAIRRMSAVVALGLGRALFAEPDFGRRLAGAALACAGAACLLLAR